MRTLATLLLLATTTMTGCATSIWEMKYGKEKPPISYAFVEEGADLDGIYAWKPDAVAAVSRTVYQVNPKTNSVITYVMPVKGLNGQDVAKTLPLFNRKTCVMSAAAIKGRDSEGGFNLTVEAPTGDTGGTIGAISRELQKVTILASPSEAATFLDVAMFGICMVAMNGDLKVEDMVELIKHSITQAADIAKTREKTKKEVLAGDADGSMEFGKITPGQPTAPPGDPGVPKERLKGPGSN